MREALWSVHNEEGLIFYRATMCAAHFMAVHLFDHIFSPTVTLDEASGDHQKNDSVHPLV